MTHSTDAMRLVPASVLKAFETITKVDAKLADGDTTIVNISRIRDLVNAAAPASPLPEGGGDWGAIRNAFVRHAEAFVKASRYEEASAIADKAAREIQDLMLPLPAAPTGDAK